MSLKLFLNIKYLLGETQGTLRATFPRLPLEGKPGSFYLIKSSHSALAQEDEGAKVM